MQCSAVHDSVTGAVKIILVSVLLSAHVKRFSVSRMQDFVVVVHNAAGSEKILCQYFGNRFSLW